ncbi:MAG TPA: alpha/beta hydrolase [Sumerlaeia bacterium]|nr:alpha/beta hydrolase [Sumerlaeia bacterium]
MTDPIQTDSKARPQTSPRRIMLTILITPVVFYLAFCLFVFLYQSHLLYYPQKGLDLTPQDAGMEYEEIILESGDEKTPIVAWYVPAREDRGTALFCHGNAGNLSGRLDIIEQYRDLGLNVLILDYRGYGRSKGRPSEEGTYEDGLAAWRYLTETRGCSPNEIVILGRSLGGAIAAWLAQRHTPGALILESAFTSVPDIGAEVYPYLPVRLLSRFRYNSLARMSEIRCPVLIAHGRDDEMIPFDHGRALFEAAREPKAFLEMTGTHNEGFAMTRARYAQEIDSFLKKRFDRPFTAGSPAPTPDP